MAESILDPITTEKLCDGVVCDGELPIANNSTKIPATPEGIALAYGSLVIMALLPIFFGSFRSVRFRKQRTHHDTMTRRDAAMFPLMASAALFGLYICFQVFGKEYINLLLTLYFFVLGVLALCHLSSSLISSLVPAVIKKVPFKLMFTMGEGENSRSIVDYEFTSHDVVCLTCCSLVGILYLVQKHWITNNLFGIAFSINGVELLELNNVATGCILLCGLFVYDIFWVFGTDVMVTVAKSFEAPIKLVFPQDILEKGLVADNFAMLGLGDIVVPGIFIALLLRFDYSLNRNTKTYFYCTFVAYIGGLLLTIAVMHIYKHAQPALLYLVPLCLCVPLSVALVKRDLTAMFQYEDHPQTKEEETKTEDNTSKKDK